MYGKQELEDFEKLINLGPTKVATFIGCKYTTYIEYKNDRRPEKKQHPAPDYILYSVQAHVLLNDDQREKLKIDRASIDIDQMKISQEIIQVFENHLGLGATYCAEFLGRKYNTYSEYKNGRQAIPAHTAYSIEAHMLLPRSVLRQLASERLDYDKLLKMSRMKIKNLEKKLKNETKENLSLLIGCSLDDYDAYMGQKKILPHRLGDCIDALLNLKEAELKKIIEDRVEGTLSTIPSNTDLAAFLSSHNLSKIQACELLSCDEEELEAFIDDEDSITEDISCLLYALMKQSPKRIASIVETIV